MSCVTPVMKSTSKVIQIKWQRVETRGDYQSSQLRAWISYSELSKNTLPQLHTEALFDECWEMRWAWRVTADRETSEQKGHLLSSDEISGGSFITSFGGLLCLLVNWIIGSESPLVWLTTGIASDFKSSVNSASLQVSYKNKKM